MAPLQKKLSNDKAREEGHWANKKKMFLKSLEFFDLLGSWFAFFLEQDFKGAIRQLQKVDHPPADTPLNFLDLQKFADNILDDKMID